MRDVFLEKEPVSILEFRLLKNQSQLQMEAVTDKKPAKINITDNNITPVWCAIKFQGK